ncbi:LacI family DNA-binding transcriptional regulator [Paenarthrobacter sp. NPDC057981]|uniref:LacI family DNA-binding transcriptional regulator n=1 Tax=Paenarthrobacter sp. NPDC057981 TaxID=3346297 RepID=UPI0036D88371
MTTVKIRINDVAAAAGVSVTTVSSVLNNRMGVRAATRDLVQTMMRDLGYVPDPHAVALRRDSKHNTARSHSKQPPPELQENATSDKQEDTAENQPHENNSPPPTSGPWSALSPSDRVQLLRQGTILGSATIDALMPDRSVVWVVMDNGLGRMMIHPSENVQLRPLPS